MRDRPAQSGGKGGNLYLTPAKQEPQTNRILYLILIYTIQLHFRFSLVNKNTVILEFFLTGTPKIILPSDNPMGGINGG
jgi:hypothetical protein